VSWIYLGSRRRHELLCQHNTIIVHPDTKP
jgi:hypothetical protein